MRSWARVEYVAQIGSAQNSGGVISLKDRSQSRLDRRVPLSGHVYGVPPKTEAGGAAIRQLRERLGPGRVSIDDVSSASPEPLTWRSELEALEPNWDEEGASPPSSDAILKAVDIVSWAERNGLRVESVDPDVLGGVAVYLRGAAPKQRAWVSILNSGRRSILIDNGSVEGRPLADESLQWLKAQFVTNDAATG